jgi:hypothetical protein
MRKFHEVKTDIIIGERKRNVRFSNRNIIKIFIGMSRRKPQQFAQQKPVRQPADGKLPEDIVHTFS